MGTLEPDIHRLLRSGDWHESELRRRNSKSLQMVRSVGFMRNDKSHESRPDFMHHIKLKLNRNSKGVEFIVL
jgi:hypothetical protein